MGNWIYGGGGADANFAGEGSDYVIGGADGDHIHGGTAGQGDALVGNSGNDYCTPAAANCERSPANDPDGGVVLRDSNKISVGFMNTDFLIQPYVQLYLVGSSGADSVDVDYHHIYPYGADYVQFTANSGSFDLSGDQATHDCAYQSSTSVKCTLQKQVDSVVLAGMGGNDNFVPTGFYPMTSLAELGGEGSDRLAGSTGGASPQYTEDMLVDGPGTDPLLQGFGGDDVLINNEGTDVLYGGNGADLLLSGSVCDGDELRGGSGVNNASWAKLTSSERVVADLATQTAGNQKGGNGNPWCGTSGAVADLINFDDLEGSNNNDGLYGGGGNNQLLGRLGSDGLIGRSGADALLAESAQSGDSDIDQTINCGPGGNDSASTDPQDPTPISC